LIEKTQKTDQTFAWGEQAKHKNLMREWHKGNFPWDSTYW